MVVVDFGVLENEFEDSSTLVRGRQRDGELLRHASQDGFVDVLYSVCGAEDNDPLGHPLAVGGCEAVPVGHESNVVFSYFFRAVGI